LPFVVGSEQKSPPYAAKDACVRVGHPAICCWQRAKIPTLRCKERLRKGGAPTHHWIAAAATKIPTLRRKERLRKGGASGKAGGGHN
jgi:hypothetical protein